MRCIRGAKGRPVKARIQKILSQGSGAVCLPPSRAGPESHTLSASVRAYTPSMTQLLQARFRRRPFLMLLQKELLPVVAGTVGGIVPGHPRCSEPLRAVAKPPQYVPACHMGT